jgi:hypothetical protein
MLTLTSACNGGEANEFQCTYDVICESSLNIPTSLSSAVQPKKITTTLTWLGREKICFLGCHEGKQLHFHSILI